VVGSDGSSADLPCRSESGISIHVTLARPVVLHRGVAYTLTLARNDGTPVEGVSSLRMENALLRPVSFAAIELMADDPPRDSL
jgi:hypothetical protein